MVYFDILPNSRFRFFKWTLVFYNNELQIILVYCDEIYTTVMTDFTLKEKRPVPVCPVLLLSTYHSHSTE